MDVDLLRQRPDRPLAGVPYDGNDPRFADLYHPRHLPAPQPGDVSRVPESWKQQYLVRLQDLIDQLQPDLMYHDGVIRFERYGLKLVAHLYNRSAERNGGGVDAVYTSKGMEDCQEGTASSTSSGGSRRAFGRTRSRPTPASPAGTTTGTPNTGPRSSASTSWSTSSAGTARSSSTFR